MDYKPKVFKPKKCKWSLCGKQFTPQRNFQAVCNYVCAAGYAKETIEKKEMKAWNSEMKARKAAPRSKKFNHLKYKIMQLKKATRKQVKLRLGLSAVSGGGKTYSALLLAKGLVGVWDKIAVIDTENESASLYSHLGDYNTLVMAAPFTPEKYIQAIKTCEDAGMECIIIDSITHEWDGKGGLLDIHSQMAGNSFTNWSSLTPRHQKFIDAILQSKCHVITTVRRKTDYELTLNDKGKQTPTKVGMKEVTRDGFEYELTVNFNLDEKHNCTASKDRTGLFMDKPFFTITEETGELIMRWCNEGKAVIPEIFKTPQEKIDAAKEILINSTKETLDEDWKLIPKEVRAIEEVKSFCSQRINELGITKKQPA